MVILDTDVLLLAFAFQRDSRQPVNTAFLEQVQAKNPAITIYSLMEILGQLSFNLSAERLSAWQSWLVDAYGLTIIWPVDPQDAAASFSFRAEIFERPFERMLAHRAAFMDALILGLAERAPEAEAFVTWNARHFKSKSALKVLTPQEYLE
jgi:predicted nucleic-acid-binding protein